MNISISPNIIRVRDHKKFAAFDYVSADCQDFGLGDVVINSANEVGVIIQVHEPGDYRTDMFGNCSKSEISAASRDQVASLRPELLKDLCGKVYYRTDRVGTAKYTVSFHDGEQLNPDGSPFFGLRIFRRKPDLLAFVRSLEDQGYKTL